MKNKYLIIMLFLSLAIVIPAKEKQFYSCSVSAGIYPYLEIGIGAVNIYKKLTVETALKVHGIYIDETAKMFGAKLNSHYFFNNPKRQGFFLLTNIGVDVVTIVLEGSASGNDYGTKIVLPNISIGTGYDFKIDEETKFFLSIEGGLEFLFLRLNLGLIF